MKAHHCTDTCQLFRILAWTWCNTYVQELVATRPEWAVAKIEPTDVSGLDSIIGVTEPLGRTISLINYAAQIDHGYAATVDLDRPITLVDIGGACLWPIDGWHRIFRARSEGRDTLPAIVLSPEAAAEAKVWGAPLPAPLLHFAEDERGPGPTLTEDEAAHQAGDGWSRRFWATAPADDQDSGLYAVVDMTFYADHMVGASGQVADVPVQITCESSYILCTDRTDPGGTERWGDTRYTTAAKEGPFTSERARELCVAFTPAEIRWDGTVNGPLLTMR